MKHYNNNKVPYLKLFGVGKRKWERSEERKGWEE